MERRTAQSRLVRLLRELVERTKAAKADNWEAVFEPFQNQLRELSRVATKIPEPPYGLFEIMTQERNSDRIREKTVCVLIFDPLVEQAKQFLIRQYVFGERRICLSFGKGQEATFLPCWIQTMDRGDASRIEAITGLESWIRFFDSELAEIPDVPPNPRVNEVASQIQERDAATGPMYRRPHYDKLRALKANNLALYTEAEKLAESRKSALIPKN